LLLIHSGSSKNVPKLQRHIPDSTIVAQGIFPVGICGTGSADLPRKKYDEYGGVIRESNM
jgi:hypothetical protein